MPVSLHLSDHNPDMNESLERCIEKAMLNLLDEWTNVCLVVL